MSNTFTTEGYDAMRPPVFLRPETARSAPEHAAKPDRTSHSAAVRLGGGLGAVAGLWARARRTALSVGGLGCLVAAAAQLGTGWGLAAAGVSLLVIEVLGGSEDDPEGTSQ